MIHESDVLVWADLFGPLGAGLFFASTIVILAVALRPSLFWPLLIFSSIMGSGPKIKGYALIDELLAASIAVGIMVPIAARIVRRQHRDEFPLSTQLFLVWMIFMIMQSLRGMLLVGDTRFIRWVVLYATLGVLAAVMSRYGTFAPARAQLHLSVLASTVITFGLYLLLGVYYDAEYPLEGGRYRPHMLLWSGPSGAVIPMAVALPSVIIWLREQSRLKQGLALASLFTMMLTAFYYDSRFAWLMIIAYFAVSLAHLPKTYVLLSVTAFVGMFHAFVGISWGSIGSFFYDVLSTSKGLFDPEVSDMTRSLQIWAALDVLADDWLVAIIGAGVHGHRGIMGPHAERLFELYVPEDFLRLALRDYYGRPLELTFGPGYRTTAVAAFLIDTGIVGTALLTAVLVLRARAVINGTSHRSIYFLTLCFAAASIMVNNMMDMVLFYLIVMPYGVLDELGRSPSGLQRVGHDIGPFVGLSTRTSGAER